VIYLIYGAREPDLALFSPMHALVKGMSGGGFFVYGIIIYIGHLVQQKSYAAPAHHHHQLQ
jgi:hypothetical protein